jgi:membrane fusion protein
VIVVYAPQPGIIVDKRVGEGDKVHEGDVLYAVASERMSATGGATQALIGLELQKRRQSLEEQMETTYALEEMERASLREVIAALESETAAVRAMIASQESRVELAAQAARRYARLRKQEYVAEEHYLAKQEEWLEQRSRLQALERESRTAARQLLDARNQLRALPIKYRNQMAELERALAAVRQESMENEARRSLLVVAPKAGVATAVRGQVGQHVDPSSPLLSIVPAGTRLQAQLYAPSRAVGFISAGDRVLMRYEAYPYQKFGHQEGTVASVSRTALSPGELQKLGEPASGGEPMYLVTVDLHSQEIHAYGEPRGLQTGMTLEGDVLHETRRLYEWVLAPLYTLTGRVH